MCVITLSFILFLVPETTLAIESRIFPGAQIDFYNHIIGYESTIPLAYNIQFGQSHPVIQFNDLTDFLSCGSNISSNLTSPLHVIFNHSIQQAQCIGNSVHQSLCNVSEITDQLFKTTREILMRDYEIENTEKQKRSSQILGEMLKYCCEVATLEDVNLIHYNAKYLTQHMNQLQDVVHKDHLQFVQISKQVDMAVETAKEALKDNYHQIQGLAKALEDSEEQTTKLWRHYLIHSHHQIFLSYMMAYQTHIASAKLDCELKHLPKSVLKFKTLKKDLEELKTKLTSTDYMLAIPVEEITKYYKLPITRCQFFENDLLISVRVPLKRKTSTLQFLQFKPIPLLWDQDICQLGSKVPLVLVNSSGTITPILESETCQIRKEPLCLVPRYTEITEVSQLCVRNIIQGTPLEDLKSICEFHCSRRLNEVLITKIDPGNFLLTNVQNETYLKCENETTHLPTNHFGTLQIRIPCHCKIVQGDEMIVKPQFPCDSRHPITAEIIHQIPFLWLNISHFKLSPAEMTNLPAFHKVNILNDNWNLSFPKIKISNERYEDIFQPLTIPSSFSSEDYHVIVSYVLLTWSMFLTIILIYFWYQLKILKAELAAKSEMVILKRPE